MKTQFLLAALAHSSTAASSLSLPSDSWQGWREIQNFVVFGDSYTTTGFNVTLTQPSLSNPLGNPPYPGYTSSNGPNWVDYLTVQFNASLIQTLNLAYGGATVDSALVAPFLPIVLSVKQQIHQEFLPLYAKHSNPKSPWKPATTLFASFIGINDIGNSYQYANRSEIYPKIFAEYQGLLKRLYKAGARSFLFVNVPPVNRSPLTKGQGHAARQTEKQEIAAWNKNVTTLAESLKNEHSDASIFVFDANSLWNKVLDRPCSFVETCAYRNTTGYCPAYENGTISPYSSDPSCEYPVDEYFWLNSLHPTFRMQYVFALEVAKQLESTSRTD